MKTTFLNSPAARVRHHLQRPLGFIALSLMGFAFAASAQQYSINWHKVAGGGDTSAGGAFLLSGTIGQHDAGGPMAGGNYSLTGGFWAPLVVQTPGAPLLYIFLTTTNTAVVWWPAPSPGWNLRQSSSLTGASWADSTAPVNVVNGQNQVVIPAGPGNQYFRLFHP